MSDLITHHRQLLGIAKSWAMKNLPGWSAESHQDLLVRHGATAVDGRISATTMSVPQLNGALGDYQGRGWERTRKVFSQGKSGAKTVPPQIAHIVRLWGRLGQAGKVQKATRSALLAYCARQLGHDKVPDLDSLDVQECQTIIESLKKWLDRK
ncbi:regulatory protein GemA [Herbaspirillum sp.]|uniref:regulatory protein GemA n=1 Tax=Herbaspirillum sp. TaxID=1890675 RepID=UPI001AFE0BA3|nr:regulatory protein GemA [Herbaspirillum sp.]MBO9538756.1 regulatory protein GemA [Herbaspirillum sp.]